VVTLQAFQQVSESNIEKVIYDLVNTSQKYELVKTKRLIRADAESPAFYADANATPQIVTQQQIRQFCDPSSTHMKFVNADESKICNVPESTPTTPNDSTTAISPSAK
jgi:hypothetical protein